MRNQIEIRKLKCDRLLLKYFYHFGSTQKRKFSAILTASLFSLLFYSTSAIAGVPNGTWLSQPQIRFYSSNNALSQLMREIKEQQYRVVFLDFRGVSDELQQIVTAKAREQKLIPIIWVQSPQYRSLSVAEIIEAARYGDGIQVDDHFFFPLLPKRFSGSYCPI